MDNRIIWLLVALEQLTSADVPVCMEQRNVNITIIIIIIIIIVIVIVIVIVNVSLVDCSLLGFVRANEKNYSNKLNRLRIPLMVGIDILASYKCSQRVEPGTTWNFSSWLSELDLN